MPSNLVMVSVIQEEQMEINTQGYLLDYAVAGQPGK